MRLAELNESAAQIAGLVSKIVGDMFREAYSNDRLTLRSAHDNPPLANPAEHIAQCVWMFTNQTEEHIVDPIAFMDVMSIKYSRCAAVSDKNNPQALRILITFTLKLDLTLISAHLTLSNNAVIYKLIDDIDEGLMEDYNTHVITEADVTMLSDPVIDRSMLIDKDRLIATIAAMWDTHSVKVNKVERADKIREQLEKLLT